MGEFIIQLGILCFELNNIDRIEKFFNSSKK